MAPQLHKGLTFLLQELLTIDQLQQRNQQQQRCAKCTTVAAQDACRLRHQQTPWQ